jgi:hypothetical protein
MQADRAVRRWPSRREITDDGFFDPEVGQSLLTMALGASALGGVHSAPDDAQGSSLPVACTLGPDDGRSRLLRWQRLHDLATPVTHLQGGHLEVRYQPIRGIQEELVSLVAAEQTCCTFAKWNVTTVEGNPVLHVTTSPEAVAPIAALFGATASAGESR